MVAHGEQSIGNWMNFYHQGSRHANLGGMTPGQVYYDLPYGITNSGMKKSQGFRLINAD
ncbi:MAG: hypothetical protein QNK20_09020 [Aureibaculum sp.]|nr:hypothetical protein [Aureibaculum sp.]